ncbi:serine/threonine protein kinase [Stanieria sp. NIES-3757]|nr:serine/threonine protein kinase [Stanieria sp. NIES-3757]
MFTNQQILQEKYQLQKQLGRTAAGHQTWLANDLNTNEKVTIKLLAFSPQMHWEELKLFEREAQVLQTLDHLRIPKYRAYFDLDKQIGEGVPWFALVQDYIPGFSLQELLEQGQRFSEAKIRKIAEETLKILIYLHQLSPPVLHRDLKPSNLILGEDEHIYLIDFGAVQAQAAVTGVTFTVVGTSGYAPLEQFWGRAVAASDLYALGATLIHLLTGISPADLPHQDSQIQFRDRVNLQPDLINWLEKITELAVEKRFANAEVALEALLSGRFISTTKKPKSFSKLFQPYTSRIQLEKNERQLKIQIPAGGLARFNEVFNAGCGGLFVYYLLFSFSFILSAFTPTIGLFIWSFVGVYAALLCGTKTDIYFEEDNLELHRTFLGKKYGKQTYFNSEIIDIFIQRTGSIFQVGIRTINHTYNLGGALSQDEAVWLAGEIRQWLNLNG